jgi:hypothetical protein
MPNRKSHDGKPTASREQVVAKAKRRFAEADVEIADIKEKGAQERRRAEHSTKEKGGA